MNTISYNSASSPQTAEDRFRFTWNWAAFLLPFIWPAYRRMYGLAIAAPLLFVLLPWWVEQFNGSPIAYFCLPGLILGMTGNYLYFLKIRSAMRQNAGKAVPCGVTIGGAAIAALWTTMVLFVGLNVPAYFSYRDRACDASALSDLRNAVTTLDAVHADLRSYASARLSSSTGVTSLIVGADRADAASSYSNFSLQRGVTLSLLDVKKDCYLISALHEQGREIYLAISYAVGHRGYSDSARGIVKVRLATTMHMAAAISEISRPRVPLLPENDANAYRMVLAARQNVSEMALKNRDAKIEDRTFEDLARDHGARIDVPYKNATAAEYTLFTRHDEGSRIFFTCACSDKIFALEVPLEAGDAAIEER